MDYDYEYDDLDEEQRPRDPATDAAAAAVRAYFAASPHKLFYSTQIETALEREYFHWITGKALVELAIDGVLQRIPTLVQGNTVNFYAEPRHRYWRRESRGDGPPSGTPL